VLLEANNQSRNVDRLREVFLPQSFLMMFHSKLELWHMGRLWTKQSVQTYQFISNWKRFFHSEPCCAQETVKDKLLTGSMVTCLIYSGSTLRRHANHFNRYLQNVGEIAVSNCFLNLASGLKAIDGVRWVRFQNHDYQKLKIKLESIFSTECEHAAGFYSMDVCGFPWAYWTLHDVVDSVSPHQDSA